MGPLLGRELPSALGDASELCVASEDESTSVALSTLMWLD